MRMQITHFANLPLNPSVCNGSIPVIRHRASERSRTTGRGLRWAASARQDGDRPVWGRPPTAEDGGGALALVSPKENLDCNPKV